MSTPDSPIQFDKPGEIADLAGYMLTSLRCLEKDFPFLMDQPLAAYLDLKDRLRAEQANPSSDETKLRQIHNELRACLEGIAQDFKNVRSLGSRNPELAVDLYIRHDFYVMAALFSQCQRALDSEIFEGMAEELVLGRSAGALGHIPVEYQVGMRKKILDILACDGLEEFSFDYLVELLQKGNDVLERIIATPDQDDPLSVNRQRVAVTIIHARRRIIDTRKESFSDEIGPRPKGPTGRQLRLV